MISHDEGIVSRNADEGTIEIETDDEAYVDTTSLINYEASLDFFDFNINGNIYIDILSSDFNSEM